MASGSLSQLTASKEGSTGTSRNWHPLTGGGDVNSGEYFGQSSGRYFPAGNSRLEVPCHAYGKGRASSFGSIHDDWKMAGPNLAPYPGSSGMMTGGAQAKKQVAGARKKSRKAHMHKKVSKSKKTKKAIKK